MKEKICYFNGKFVKESEFVINLAGWDGILWEGGAYDVARTYDRVPFHLKEHINRLFYTIKALPIIQFNLTPEEVTKITLEVLSRNEEYFDEEEDVRIIWRVSRGVILGPPTPPSFYVYLGPLVAGYAKIAEWYLKGAHLVVANTRQIPWQCLDPKIKHTNRLCNHLAEFEAKQVDPEAFALMLDINGFAAECQRDNFFMVKDGKLLTSRLIDCLPGISRATVIKLAKELGIECVETDLCVYDLYNADELMIAATSFFVIPVSKFNGRTLPGTIPGPITKQLQSAFSKKVNYDIVQRVLDKVQPKG